MVADLQNEGQENDDSHGDFATSYFIVSMMPVDTMYT
jgi:hypothetical protein